MKTLIYFTSVTGHNIEFIHHLYMGYFYSEKEALFVIPEKFHQQESLFDWPKCERITFDYLSAEEIGSLGDSLFRKSFRFSKLLRKYMTKNHVRVAFVADLMGLMPFLPFVLSKRFSIYGLTFGVYLYRWYTRAKYKSLLEAICHCLMAKSKSIKSIYVGNDTSAPLYYNRLFKTHKYKYVPDPFNCIEVPFRDLRKEYGIAVDKKVMYHFGSMGGRKGTIQIINSIIELNEEEREKYVFVFAGIVQDKEAFYNAINKIENRNNIFIFDRFCDFEFISQWCQCCDAILIPYSHTHSSSGLLGYAAQYKKPVIGPNSGLIGKLIRRNHLGLDLDIINSDKLRRAYQDIDNWNYRVNNYVSKNSVSHFSEIVINDCCNK